MRDSVEFDEAMQEMDKAATAVVELCLDTNILIDFLKNRELSATALEGALTRYRCGVTAIIYYELLYGMARAQHSIGEEVMTEALTVLPLVGQRQRWLPDSALIWYTPIRISESKIL